MRSETRAMRTGVQEGGEGLINHLRAWDTSTGIKLFQTWEEPAAPPQGLLVPVPRGPISVVSCTFHIKSFSQCVLDCSLFN